MRYVVAITGASGSRYGLRLVEVFLEKGFEVHLLISQAGEKVLHYEEGIKVEGKTEEEREIFFRNFFRSENLFYHDEGNFASTLSSGSFIFNAMIVIPSSMSTVASIANGVSQNLIHRVAEVALKQERKLIIVPRETPLSLVHLKNLVKAKEAGAVILPAMPGFYTRPQTVQELVDFVVGKVLDVLEVDHKLYPRWQGFFNKF